MKMMKIVVAALMTAAGAAAVAGPTDLGTGPGLYSFADNHDSAWYVTLGPGTYSFASTVSSVGFDLAEVWLSTSKDHKSSNDNDLGVFDQISSTQWSEMRTLTLTQTTDLYIDVNTHLGKLTNGNFAGSFAVSAVPEPTSAALLLAGIGLFGFMRKRRQD